MEKMKNFLAWYKTTSMIIGVPVLFLLIFLGVKKFTYTSTCMLVNYRCELAIGADDSLVSYMGDLLAANPGTEIVAKSRSK